MVPEIEATEVGMAVALAYKGAACSGPSWAQLQSNKTAPQPSLETCFAACDYFEAGVSFRAR